LKILLDHCVPAPLRRSFPTHDVRTTAQMGWANLQNGRLMAAAAPQFQVFLTVDKNIPYQQNLDNVQVAVIFLDTPTNTLEALLPLVPVVESVLPTLKPGHMIVIDGKGTVRQIHPTPR
jgi:hypothetical protein